MKFPALVLAALLLMIACTENVRQNNQVMNKDVVSDICKAICYGGGLPLKRVYKIIESHGEQIEQVGFARINGMRFFGSGGENTNRLGSNLGMVVRDQQGNRFQINLCVDACFSKEEDVEPVAVEHIIDMQSKVRDYLNHDNTRLKFLVTGVEGPFAITEVDRFFLTIQSYDQK